MKRPRFVPGRAAIAMLAALMSMPVPGCLAAATVPPLPTDSVYQLDVALLDQAGRASRFPEQRGAVRIVSMFYATCPYVCPMIVEAIKRTEAALPADARARLRVTLVTLDPERDTPSVLAETAAKRRIDTARWTLVRTDAGDVRTLAALLGIQYRQLENREFNHSSALILLDAQGRVRARSSRIGAVDPEFLAAVREALADEGNP